MTRAFQMPVLDLASTEVAPRTFRKQILRTGSIPYEGKTLTFDKAYLEQAVASFNAKAMDAVPFVLADENNKHSADPDRLRGEVKSLAMTEDGVDAIVELTPEGAELVSKYPKLGVSPRLVVDVERDGKTFPVVIEHVCGTLSPRLAGMKPWESISLSVLWPPQDGSREQVIDLSNAEYMTTATLTDEQLKTLQDLKPEERAAKLREFVPSEPAKTDVTEDADAPKFRDKLKSLLSPKPGEEEDIDKAIDNLLAEPEPVENKELVASLSKEHKDAIDLANSDAASAKAEAQKARREVAEAKWELEREKYAKAGVPPAMLDLCDPIFKDGQSSVIDLSNGEKFDAADTIRKLLKSAEKFVDLSKATGSDAGEDDDERADAKTKAEAWGKESDA